MSFRPPTADPGERATMRMARGAGVVLAGALVVTTAVVGASAAAAAPASGAVSWSPPLVGEAAGTLRPVLDNLGRWRVSASGSRARGRGRCRPRSPRCWSAPARRSARGRWSRCGRCSRWSSPSRSSSGVNYANDYSDGIRGTDDERVGPLRLVGSRLAAPAAVRNAAFLCFSVAALAGLALVSLTRQWWLVAVGAVCIAGAWFYTGGRRPTATPGSARWPSSCSSGWSRCSGQR